MKMDKFKCAECGVNEVDDEGDICDGCFESLYEDDMEEDEDDD